ncbi:MULTISPECIES: DUF2268 domain-containing putative Zn-dependent protease [Bacillus]|uniref:DUF2268 domain-containing putative Zn-dependent protease n=1 Tax=Bacillus TaxID=1386 RepID=UPI0002FC5EC1|nr:MULTISPECIES: DUF2268 domain-containing putative Zn-dependent protease [Bacillus]
MKKFIVVGVSILLVVFTSLFLIYKFYKIELFKSYYDTNKVKKVGNIVFHYNPESEEKVEGIEDYLRKITSFQKEWFNYVVKKEIHIFLGKSDEELQHDDKGSYYEYLKIIYLNSEMEKEQFDNILAHELAHLYFTEYVKDQNINVDDIPLWFHEGIAMSFAQRLSPSTITERVVKSEPLMDISPKKMDDGKNAYYGSQYIEMMFAVEYIIHQKKLQLLIR